MESPRRNKQFVVKMTFNKSKKHDFLYHCVPSGNGFGSEPIDLSRNWGNTLYGPEKIRYKKHREAFAAGDFNLIAVLVNGKVIDFAHYPFPYGGGDQRTSACISAFTRVICTRTRSAIKAQTIL